MIANERVDEGWIISAIPILSKRIFKSSDRCNDLTIMDLLNDYYELLYELAPSTSEGMVVVEHSEEVKIISQIFF